jgi:hypothetical protein
MNLRITLAALLLCGPALAREPGADITALIAELGLKESPVAARDLPGWHKPARIVVGYLPPEQVAELQAVVPEVAGDVVVSRSP